MQKEKSELLKGINLSVETLRNIRTVQDTDPQWLSSYFCPDKRFTDKEASQLFYLWCLHYFPDIFYHAPSKSHMKAGEFLQKTRYGGMSEWIWVGTGGVGKTVLLAAEVAYSILNQTETLIVYSSAVHNNVYTFVPQVLRMVADYEVTETYGLHVNEDMVGLSTLEKKRAQRRTDFVFKNGVRVVSNNLFSSVRGLLHSDLNVKASKISLLVMDDCSTSNNSQSQRLKGRVEAAILEARRSMDKSNSRNILLANITKWKNYAQDVLQEKSIPYLITPLTDQATYFDGKTEGEVGAMKTGTNLSDVFKTQEQAEEFNDRHPEFKHASWVDNEYNKAGNAWEWECECRFWESSDLIFGRYEGDAVVGKQIPMKQGTTLHLYPFNQDEYTYIGCDLGGGREKDPSVIVGLTEIGVVNLVLETNRVTPDKFAEIIKSVTEYTKHYMVVIEDDAGAGAEAIRVARSLIPNGRLWREITHDKVKNVRSSKYGWTPSSAKIENIMDKLAECKPDLTLNNDLVINQMNTMTWDHLKERDTTLPHHFDLVRALAMANHIRMQMKLLKK